MEPGPALGVCIGDKHSVEIVIHDVESDVRTEMAGQSLSQKRCRKIWNSLQLRDAKLLLKAPNIVLECL